eukprot:GHVU01235151.1.p1 GENE.GHVU01235151.1~~GHVU01235151.1.p1  ORF type:complete len:192 (-),score=9.02 GHVU01235151.1:872-1447(-)
MRESSATVSLGPPPPVRSTARYVGSCGRAPRITDARPAESRACHADGRGERADRSGAVSGVREELPTPSRDRMTWTTNRNDIKNSKNAIDGWYRVVYLYIYTHACMDVQAFFSCDVSEVFEYSLHIVLIEEVGNGSRTQYGVDVLKKAFLGYLGVSDHPSRGPAFVQPGPKLLLLEVVTEVLEVVVRRRGM